MADREGFSHAARQRTELLRRAITALPLVQEIAAGTLRPDIFRHFIGQGAHFLHAHLVACQVVSSRADNRVVRNFYDEMADTSRQYAVELVALAGLRLPEADATPQSFATLAYGCFLIARASHAPLAVAQAAFLPCLDVYHDMGEVLSAATGAMPHHPYRSWVDLNRPASFSRQLTLLRAFVNDGARAAPEQGEAMMQTYLDATRLEWIFHEAAWRGEDWPIRAGT